MLSTHHELPIGFPKLSLLVTSFWLETPLNQLPFHQGLNIISMRPRILTSLNYRLASVMQHDLSRSLVPPVKSDLKPTLVHRETFSWVVLQRCCGHEQYDGYGQWLESLQFWQEQGALPLPHQWSCPGGMSHSANTKVPRRESADKENHLPAKNDTHLRGL